MSAGARFIVMRDGGKSNPLFLMAERTLSRLSLTAVSGKSYNVKARHTARNIRFDAGHIGFHAEKPDAYDFSKHFIYPFLIPR